jgi:hypothetical protein
MTRNSSRDELKDNSVAGANSFWNEFDDLR